MYEVNNFTISLVIFIGAIIASVQLGWNLCMRHNNKKSKKNNKNNEKEKKDEQ